MVHDKTQGTFQRLDIKSNRHAAAQCSSVGFCFDAFLWKAQLAMQKRFPAVLGIDMTKQQPLCVTEDGKSKLELLKSGRPRS